MQKTKHVIRRIKEGSIAEEMGMEPGDELLEIGGQEIVDIFDYQYLTQDEYIEVLIRRADGEEWLLEIDKEYDEDLGIEFENGLMDDYRSCHNKCIFCFIDQMPKGMRETLYFKDDDSRLSFLQGNYVTLTNMSDEDVERIIRYHLSPINISFQTTNPELRCMMLNNRFAGQALLQVRKLYEAGITMNGQIVLCKGVNDGAELERSIADLTAYLPHLESVSVVPVGLSKYREGLYPLEPFSKEDAEAVERRFPSVPACMIGRGIIADPGLLGEITRGEKRDYSRLRRFHDLVYEEYRSLGMGDRNVLFKMKELWSYLGVRFEGGERLLKRLKKAGRMEEYKAVAGQLFEDL